MTTELIKKVDLAVKLIRTFAPKSEPVEICYSGGKDSDVILTLVKLAGVDYRAIYKNTTIDPPGTIKHCRDNGVDVLQPKLSFLKLIEQKGMPTRRARFCCKVLKEYKVLNYSIQGIRVCESTARAKRYNVDDPIICRTYGSKKNHCNVLLPILSWSDEDVKQFIEYNKIKCHPLYYDETGQFQVNRRLGCLGCPMKRGNGKSDFEHYPKLFRQVAKSLFVWWYNHPNSKSRTKFRNPYGLLAHNIWYDSYNDWLIADQNIFGDCDWKTLLEHHFNIDLNF